MNTAQHSPPLSVPPCIALHSSHPLKAEEMAEEEEEDAEMSCIMRGGPRLFRANPSERVSLEDVGLAQENDTSTCSSKGNASHDRYSMSCSQCACVRACVEVVALPRLKHGP